MEFWLRKYSGDSSAIIMVYVISVLDSISFQFNSPISPSPLPEEGGDENILVKITGNTNTVNLSWILKEESSNIGSTNPSVSNLYSGNSKTVMEQLKWFTDSDEGFVGTGIDHSFDFVIVENGAHSGDKFSEQINAMTSNESVRKGYIRNLSFDTSGNEPVTLRAKMDFIEGNVISSYNGNTPSVPRNFSVSKGNASGQNKDTTMYITWTLSSKNGGSALTNHVLYYRVAGGEWVLNVVSGSSQAIVLSGLSSGTTYDFKIAAKNANGLGSESYIRTKSTD
mgnify:CR=1 FL=1